MDRLTGISPVGLSGITSPRVGNPYGTPEPVQQQVVREPAAQVPGPPPMHESPPLPVVVQRAALDLATHGSISPEVAAQLRTALAAVYSAGY